MTDDAADTKYSAQLLMEYYQETQSRISEQHAEMAKWLLASLLAVNTGGLAALVASVDKISISLASSALFLLGIFLALGAGAAIQRSNVRALKPIAEIIGGLLPYAAGREIDVTQEEIVEFLEGKEASARAWAWFPPVLGYLSAACFALGALIAGVSWANSVTETNSVRVANDQRCIALEKDMLSGKPRRTDAPELFRTFGCKPQTSLPVHQRR